MHSAAYRLSKFAESISSKLLDSLAKAADVDTVLVNFKIVMEDRKVAALNVEKILDLAETNKNCKQDCETKNSSLV